MNYGVAHRQHRLRQALPMPDGRTITYAEYGPASGGPVFYFHGLSGSRLEPGILDGDELEAAGVHLIAPDRPGMGGSDFQPGRGSRAWTADVACMADMLMLRKFGVWGVSGGGGPVHAAAKRSCST